MLNQKKIIKIIAKSLSLPEQEINERTNNKNLEEWDSLGHLSILTAIDNETKGEASKIETLSACTSIKEILETLKKNNLAS